MTKFCGACGAPRHEGTRFCVACGARLVDAAAGPEPPGSPAIAPTPAAQARPGDAAHAPVLLLFAGVFFGILIVGPTDFLFGNNVLLFFFAGFGALLAASAFIVSASVPVRRWRLVAAGIALAVGASTGWIGWQRVEDAESRAIAASAALLEDITTELIATKHAGDTATQRGESLATFGTLAAERAAVVDRLKPPIGLVSYWAAVAVYADLLATASRDRLAWLGTKDRPVSFTLVLSDRQEEEALATAIVEIDRAKALGDEAVSSGDRTAMLYIAARLRVLDLWLEALGSASEPQLFSSWPGSLAEAASDPAPTQLRRTPCVGVIPHRLCLPDVHQPLPAMSAAAFGFAVNAPTASQQWSTASTAPGVAAIEAAAQALGGTGVTVGAGPGAVWGPNMTAFMNACHAARGTVDGSGGVTTGVPTTEGGHVCWHSDTGCWDKMTYSGRRFEGGAPGCPQLGLLPPAAAARPAPTPATAAPRTFAPSVGPPATNVPRPTVAPTTAFSWDGVYDFTQTGQCSSTAFPVPPFSGNNQVTVRGNAIIGPPNLPIDANGRAVYVMDLAQYGAPGSFNWTFNFTRSGPTVGFTGTMSGSVQIPAPGAGTVSVSCTGTINGRRR